MTASCPPDCRQDRERHDKEIHELYERSIPTWSRPLLIGSIAALFAFYGALWVYVTTNYETKEDAKQKSQENKEEFRRINDKLDRLLQRP